MADQKDKKSKIPYIFFAFFAVIFAVDFTFMYLANTTWRGLATENSYEKGLQYNQTLAEEKKQEALGWKMGISFTNFSNKSGKLLVNLQDRNIRTIPNAKIAVTITRPVQDGYDFTQSLEFIGGIYEAKIDFPLKGQWDFLVHVEKDGDIFKQTKRFIVQ